ncbi:MAG: hypothetical protein JXA73_24520 [Acidobacteria bacterium]|nr:hypothetical protein [Acidobacteriota bacterium]
MGHLNRNTRANYYIREMSVAQIRESYVDYVEVAFLESARYYRLHKRTPSFKAFLDLLKAAQAEGGVLRITFASPDSDSIEEVSKPAKQI